MIHCKPRSRSVRLTVAALFVLITGWSVYTDRAHADKPIEVQLDEQIMQFEQEPFLQNGTTLVQFRPLFEAMGLEIEWDDMNRVVTGISEHMKITLAIGQTTAFVNGEAVEVPLAPLIKGGHTLVPVRFVSEATGALVAWNPYKPQILIYTEDFLDRAGLTKEQAEAEIERQLAAIKEAYEAEQAANQPPTPIPVPDPPKGGGEYKPAASGAVELAKLGGMYYGFRSDFGGYECGGICWDLYTFLPGNRIFVGAPPNGGPETLDCAKDECSAYTIQNGEMTLDNGDSYSIGVLDGKLVINDVALTPVKTVSSPPKLSGSYLYQGYWGLVGITSGSSSWKETITFYDNGTFKSDDITIGSVQGAGTTHGTASKSSAGSYKITGNTLVLAFHDGTTAHLLFFDHEDSDDGPFSSIQIGENNFDIQ